MHEDINTAIIANMKPIMALEYFQSETNHQPTRKAQAQANQPVENTSTDVEHVFQSTRNLHVRINLLIAIASTTT